MNECCQKPENRKPGPGPRGGPDNGDVTHCVVCSCRHFELEAEPVVVGVKVESL